MQIYPLQCISLALKFLYDFAGGDPAESPKGKKKTLQVRGRVPSLKGLYITTSARRYNVWKAIT